MGQGGDHGTVTGGVLKSNDLQPKSVYANYINPF